MFLILWLATQVQEDDLSASLAQLASDPKYANITDRWLDKNISSNEAAVLPVVMALSRGYAGQDPDRMNRVIAAYCDRELGINSLPALDENEVIADLGEFARAFEIVHAGQKLLRSNQGFLAIAPLLAEGGDYIAVFAGADAPFIIRPAADGFYKLIGECYVEDIMKGQAFDRGPVTSITLV